MAKSKYFETKLNNKELTKNFSDIILILENKTGNYIMIALKTTKNKDENYIKTYHIADIEKIKRDLINEENTIIYNNLDIKKE